MRLAMYNQQDELIHPMHLKSRVFTVALAYIYHQPNESCVAIKYKKTTCKTVTVLPPSIQAV
jgi:hypothetical protein